MGQGWVSGFDQIGEGGLGTGHALELYAARVKNEPVPVCRVTCLTTGKRGGGRDGRNCLPFCRSFPLPPLKRQRAGWLGAGALEAPECGSKGSFFFFFFWARRNWDPPEPRRSGGGGAAGAGSGPHRADAPRSPAAGAHRSRSPTAVASRHDTAAATKRRSPRAPGTPHRSPGPTPRGGRSGRCPCGCVDRVGSPGARGLGKALKCAGSRVATSSASSSAARLRAKQFAVMPESRLNPVAPREDPGTSLCLQVPPASAPRPSRANPGPPAVPGPGTRPAPRARRPRLWRGRRPRPPSALTRRREPAIIVALATRLQEARAVLLFAEVPMAEPGAPRGARGAWPPGSWSRRLLLPSAASTAASRAGSPSTSNTPCALRQPGSRTEEGGGDGGSGDAQHLPSRAAARAWRGSGGCSPRLPVLSSDSGSGEPGRRAGRERAKEQLPIAKPPAAANHPPPLPRPAGEGLSRATAGRGDTRGGAEGAGDRPFVMSPGRRPGSLCDPTWKGVPGRAERERVPLGVG